MATVLDEAMGAVAWFNGHSALAVNLNVNLRHGVPLETPLSVTGWIEKVDGRKVHTAAELYLPDGRVAASSTGLFISVEFSGMTQENNPFRPLKEQG
ncbi:MAG: PaaI family thioesterase [Chloroflexi bacterium]|nr:PaaI family thioesterase [Chloroflexota bacterium]